MPNTPRIHTHTATEMGMLVNVHLVETAHGVVVIDGGVALSSSRAVRRIIDEEIGKPLLAVLLTHGHPDHYMGVAEIIGDHRVDFYALQGAIDQAKSRDEDESAGMRQAFGDNFPEQRIFPNQVVEDGDLLVFDSVCFRVWDFGGCESDSDGVWFIEHSGDPLVFCGDLIYNQMHLFMKDGHPLAWLSGLDRLCREFSPEALFYPAHGECCGREGIYWAQAYIVMYLRILGDLLKGDNALNPEGQQRLITALRSYLPNDNLIELAQFKLDETIRVLSPAANAAVQQESEEALWRKYW